MINYCGYYNQHENNTPLNNTDLFVKSCGHYKLLTLKGINTQRKNWHNDYELIFITGGIAHFFKEGRRYDIEKDSLVLYKPEESQFYKLESENNVDIYWISFTGSKVEELLNKVDLNSKLPMQLEFNNDITGLFQKIISELRLTKPLYIEIIKSYFIQLLIALSRNLHHNDRSPRLSNSLIDSFLYDFHQVYYEDINISQYATMKNISCSWFIREFKRYKKCSPKQYITNFRIQKAKEFLSDTSLTIKDVSTLTGYDDQLYFCRIFKKYTGMSPSNFRKTISAS